jgi:hypothetical protein
MRSPIAVRKEHKYVCEAMRKLEDKNDGKVPLEADEGLYFRLYAVKNTLEWVHPSLIKTKAKTRGERWVELVGYRHVAMGPTRSQLYP